MVAGLTKKNVENLTGGHSFAIVYPKFVSGSIGNSLFIHNQGDQILSGVTVLLQHVTSPCNEQGDTGDMTIEGEPVNLTIGALPPHFGNVIASYVFFPKLLPDGTGCYNIKVDAQNGGVSEELLLRPSADKSGLEYKLLVSQGYGPLVKGPGFQEGPQKHRWVLKTDWMPPIKWQ